MTFMDVCRQWQILVGIFFPNALLKVEVGRPGNRFQLDNLPHDSDSAKMRATALPLEMIWVIIALRVLTVLLKTRKHAVFQKDSFP